MAIQAQLYPEFINVGFGFGSSQDWIMENVNGCCGGVGKGEFNQLCFETQQKQQQHQQFYLLQNQQQFDTNSANFLKNSGNFNTNAVYHHQSMPFSQTMALQVEKQRQEIDQYIRSQVGVNCCIHSKLTFFVFVVFVIDLYFFNLFFFFFVGLFE